MDASDTITGQAVLAQADVDGALRKSGVTRSVRSQAVMVLLCPVLFYLIQHLVGGQDLPFSDFVPALVFGAAMVAVLYFAQRSAARKHLEGKTAHDLDIRYELDANGYHIQSPSTAARCAWTSVHHFDESEAAFLIFPSATVQVVVPKRAFAEADVPRVRALLQTSVKQPKKTLLRSPKVRVLVLWLALIIMFAVIYITTGAPR